MDRAISLLLSLPVSVILFSFFLAETGEQGKEEEEKSDVRIHRVSVVHGRERDAYRVYIHRIVFVFILIIVILRVYTQVCLFSRSCGLLLGDTCSHVWCRDR